MYYLKSLVLAAFVVQPLGFNQMGPGTDGDEPIACEASIELKDWLESVLQGWDRFSEVVLQLPHANVPLIVVLGEFCSWTLAADQLAVRGGAEMVAFPHGNRRLWLAGLGHEGEFEMPNGELKPVAPMAYTSTYDQGTKPFFAISSLPIWRKVVADAPNIDVPSFFRGVAIHELVHTTQIVWSTRRLTELIDNNSLEGVINDDMFQERFGSDPDYETAYRRERATFLEALKADDKAELMRLAAQGMSLYRERQRSYFGKQAAVLRAVEDIFLTMEGSSIWASFEIEPPEGEIGRAAVARYYANKDGSWIQDEGMLIAALVHELVPDWKPRVYRNQPALLTELLEAAVGATD